MAQNINDWKACNRHKRFPSSNLGHSAKNARPQKVLGKTKERGKTWQFAPIGGKITAEQPQQMRKVRVSLYYGRSFDKQGTAPLLLAVNHASSSCYIPLQGVRLKRNQWDSVRKKVVNHPQADTINSVALSTLGKANEAVMQLGNVRGLSTAQVRDLIADYIAPPDKIDTGVIATLKNYQAQCLRPNSADKFRQTHTHLMRWLGTKQAKALQFADITPDWLQSFDRYLVTYCPSINSRGIHLRNIRTLFNFALNHQLTTAPYPFRQFKIKTAPSNPTPLTLEQLRTLFAYAPQSEAQAYALDIFKLVFALIGINLADLCQLQGISQGRINYTRAKTGRLYSVKVEDCAKSLIKAHRGRKYLVDILEHYKDLHVATSQINRQLKHVASALELPPISTYTARYTWATLAQSIDTPIEVISQALGHSYGMAVTLGYILPDKLMMQIRKFWHSYLAESCQLREFCHYFLLISQFAI